MAAKKPKLTEEDLADLRKNYDPGLVDALTSRIDDLDAQAAFTQAISLLIDQARGTSPFDEVALIRREQEALLIEQEVRMFEQSANLMTQISQQYSNLTGVPVPDAGNKG